MMYLRQAFAVLSWVFAFGLLVLLIRGPSGQAGGFLLMSAAFAANGWLHWSARKSSC